MAIEKEYGYYIPVCDGCLKTLAKCQNFQDAVDLAKAEGWRSIKINGMWQNRCPNCQSTGTTKFKPNFGLDW